MELLESMNSFTKSRSGVVPVCKFRIQVDSKIVYLSYPINVSVSA
jgi:hypothetical protein